MQPRPIFDSCGRRRGHVAFFRSVSPDEYDAAGASFRPLARAAGDLRPGRALLADCPAEQGMTFDRLAGSVAGREALQRLAAAVRAAFAPAAAYLQRMEAAAPAGSSSPSSVRASGGAGGGLGPAAAGTSSARRFGAALLL